MKKIGSILLMAGLTFGLAACGGNGDSSGEGNSGGDDVDQTTSVDADAAEGVFKENCASCHGENLEGKNGPALDKIGSDLSKDEILEQIKNGGGGMPSGLIEGDEAENVAGWLADMK